jgi:superfamily I DNA and RNA helicase
MLIDEAQDLPREFLRLAFHSTANHRIVWAYDDLQNLSDYQTQSLRETFGIDKEGNQVVTLVDRPKQPRQDIILPRCYRNSPWALATAHALGSGIYRREKLVQHPDDPLLWRDIGYEVREGHLELGQPVVLQRDPAASPDFFRHLLKPDDAIRFFAFSSDQEQLAAVTKMIGDNLSKDELYAHDIVVIFPDALVAQKRGALFQQILRESGIESHVAGVTTSRDVFSVEGSVAISGPHRAKGNEAPMVYLMDAQYCASGPELIKRRNTLFTSVTRSRGWVRVFGEGPGIQILLEEFEKLSANGFRLRFTIPTVEELQRIRTQHRDITQDEKRKVAQFTSSVNDILAKDEATTLLHNLPKELREKLIRALQDAEE